MDLPERRALFEIWRQNRSADEVMSYVIEHFHLNDCHENVRCSIMNTITALCVHFLDKWRKCSYSKTTFYAKYSSWLDGVVSLNETVMNAVRNRMPCSSKDTGDTRKGRPKKTFAEGSEKTKKRIVEPLLKSSSEQLLFASKLKLQSAGKRSAAKIVTKIYEDPGKASDIKRYLDSPQKSKPIKMTPDEALAFFVDAKLTRHQYILIRNEAKRRNADIYPCYDKIIEAKKRCYPENIEYSNTEATVDLQSLLDHTVTRLVYSEIDKIKKEFTTSKLQLKFFFKWGCDGASSQSNYKQKFDDNSRKFDDSSLFIVCLVPLMIQSTNEQIIWSNPCSGSTRYCRPIKVTFQKESSELVQQVVQTIKNQISNLEMTKVCVAGYEISLEHNMLLTMVDGKVCSYLTNTNVLYMPLQTQRHE